MQGAAGSCLLAFAVAVDGCLAVSPCCAAINALHWVVAHPAASQPARQAWESSDAFSAQLPACLPAWEGLHALCMWIIALSAHATTPQGQDSNMPKLFCFYSLYSIAPKAMIQRGEKTGRGSLHEVYLR